MCVTQQRPYRWSSTKSNLKKSVFGWVLFHSANSLSPFRTGEKAFAFQLRSSGCLSADLDEVIFFFKIFINLPIHFSSYLCIHSCCQVATIFFFKLVCSIHTFLIQDKFPRLHINSVVVFWLLKSQVLYRFVTLNI